MVKKERWLPKWIEYLTQILPGFECYRYSDVPILGVYCTLIKWFFLKVLLKASSEAVKRHPFKKNTIFD
jgi:hypothetical protein